MKTYTLGLFALLGLSVLFLSACQPVALEMNNPAAEQAGEATQPVGGATGAPSPIPAGTAIVGGAAETAQPSTGMQVPLGWQVITDTSQGYSLAYPPEWDACEEHRYSRIFCEIQEQPSGLGPPLRLYVSAVPQTYTNSDFDVYNFISHESIREFMALPIGESKLREPNAMPPDYFTYTRLPDRMVAGWNALVIENSKVWEFPPGTMDRVVMIVTEGTTYTLGMYYETPQQLELFEQVLDSFQFVP